MYQTKKLRPNFDLIHMAPVFLYSALWFSLGV